LICGQTFKTIPEILDFPNVLRRLSLRIKKRCGAAALVPVVLVLTACSAIPAPAAGAPAEPIGVAGIPVTVQGFLPGYSDSELLQSVTSCVAQVPATGTIGDAPHPGWQVQVDVQNVYMPHIATEVRVTLLHEAHVAAFRWQRAPDAAAPQQLCGTVSRLTQQAWASVSVRDMVSSARDKS
jgi:hypothetical protein